jgi:hypothetical protein
VLQLKLMVSVNLAMDLGVHGVHYVENPALNKEANGKFLLS